MNFETEEEVLFKAEKTIRVQSQDYYQDEKLRYINRETRKIIYEPEEEQDYSESLGKSEIAGMSDMTKMNEEFSIAKRKDWSENQLQINV